MEREFIWVVGTAECFVLWLFLMLGWYLINRRKTRYMTILKTIKYLTKVNNHCLTLTDLVLETSYSPSECKKVLNRLAIELGADINLTESGKIYYKFPTAENIKLLN